MELLVVRHAIAEDREVFARTGRGDAERPLTAEGRRRFEKGARGLRRLVESIDVLATSTLARAIETGDLLAAACEIGDATRVKELAPEAEPAALVPWLRRHAGVARVAVVGHEPHLSELVGYLLAGKRGGFVALGKGGACLLALTDPPGPGRAELRWLLTPGQLRRLR